MGIERQLKAVFGDAVSEVMQVWKGVWVFGGGGCEVGVLGCFVWPHQWRQLAGTGDAVSEVMQVSVYVGVYCRAVGLWKVDA